MRYVLFLCLLLTRPVAACDLALVLAIDISGSIDAGEYAEQINGLALAVQDPAVVDALVQDNMALTVVHWSGTGRQAVVIDWQRMQTPADVAAFAERVRAAPRAFRASDTAIGEAIAFSSARFAQVPDCRRKVIDISGDGPENAGFNVSRERVEAQKDGITINAIAIEDMGRSTPIAAFYRKWTVTKDGFVIVARGLQDYPRAMREKLLREISKPIG